MLGRPHFPHERVSLFVFDFHSQLKIALQIIGCCFWCIIVFVPDFIHLELHHRIAFEENERQLEYNYKDYATIIT